MEKEYTPSKKILEKYADVLVNFALNEGKPLKKGAVVRVVCPEVAKPLYREVCVAVWKRGGHVLPFFVPSTDAKYNISKDFYTHAQKHQLEFFPEKYWKAFAEVIDHSIYIISETDKDELKGVDTKKIMKIGEARKPLFDWLSDKEDKENFTWTLALYGTQSMAQEAGLSQKDYWAQIIKACFLNKKDSKEEWKKTLRSLRTIQEKLNDLCIDTMHIEGPDIDLHIGLSPKSAWQAGTGRNIPSFECFTSPDWRRTEGWVRFSEPLYRYGNKIEGIELRFKKGKVIKSSATKNEKVLKAMIATKNADKVGEYSLTDARMSKITKFMGETLYDENTGGVYGNTHLALGNAYRSGCYKGDASKVKKSEWEKLGYNESSVHTDIISTTRRTVTAILQDGREMIIYKDGKFTFPIS
ncbi:MAG: aminopeptidase [Flavobacteriaceae bacterium]|jgi:aminopeptidase